MRHGSITSVQRVWKRQPDGGAAGTGCRPAARCARARVDARGSGTGIAESSASVYGCFGRVVHLFGGTLLDDASEVHHRDAVADVAHEREVVRDEEVGEAELLLQVAEQVDDVGLDRHVEAAHRLVEHEQLGGERQRPGDGDALQLAAGELARVAVAVLGVEAHGAQQVARLLLPLLLREVEVVAHRLGQAVGDRRQRVERRERVLEHELHAAAAVAHLTLRQPGDVGAVERDVPAVGSRSRSRTRPSVDFPDPTRRRARRCARLRPRGRRRRPRARGRRCAAARRGGSGSAW